MISDEKKFHVLWLTNMYPSEKSQKGIFVQEQVLSVSKADKNFTHSVFNIDDFNKYGFLKYFFCNLKLVKELLKKRVDIIHIHFGLSGLSLFPLFIFILYLRPKVFLTCHGSDLMGGKIVNLITNVVAFFSDALILVSSEQCSYLWGVNKRKEILFIPCGVDSKFFYYKNECITKTEKRVRLIFPSSRSRPEKNYNDFFNVTTRLSLIGIEVCSVYFEDMDRDAIRDAYFDNDLLLLTSKREGSPQVVKEAIFTGLPIVSFDVGDVKDILDGSDQCLISNDLDEIVNFIARFESYPYRLKREFVDDVVNRYDASVIAIKIINGYYSILHK